MSIATELENYATYLGNAYNKCSDKGATIPTNKNLQNLTNCIDSIPAGGTVEVQSKDVDFLDYDGTIVYSYTATEFANLTALPANPTHDGLISQGWNWTLADAKAYVASYGFLDIGQLYEPAGRFHLYIH